MLKLPKGLKKKKKGKKSKRKGEEELFTEEELEKYRKEHQKSQNLEAGEGQSNANEEWSKFKDLTSGIDSVLKKTQGDLNRIKSTSFFQRIPAGPKEVDSIGKEVPPKEVLKTLDEFQLPQISKVEDCAGEGEKSDYAITDTESEEEEQDDIFDTSFVDAVERGEVKLGYVPDSPDNFEDDNLFDTSHVDALIKGQESKASKGKKALDIGVAVEVLTGRIDNVTITSKKSKRIIPGDLLLESTEKDTSLITKLTDNTNELSEKSILDTDADIPISSPIDLSRSLYTSIIQKSTCLNVEEGFKQQSEVQDTVEDEFDEFTLLATESLEVNAEVKKIEKEVIDIKPVLEESWSAFEVNKNYGVFAESIIEDQTDADSYINEVDPFDTSFAELVVSSLQIKQTAPQSGIVEEDDEFDPRADEVNVYLNNRRKSSVRIHLTDPAGLRESITSDDIYDKEDSQVVRDLLGGSTTDLTQLNDSPLNPIDINIPDILDPFDTTLVDNIVAPGKVELKLLEQELIEAKPIYQIETDPDFDPRAEEPKKEERRASRPENLIVNKSVVFDVHGTANNLCQDIKVKHAKPLTPYYNRDLSITEYINEEIELTDNIVELLKRTRSDEEISSKVSCQNKRRHSEYPHPVKTKFDLKSSDLFEEEHCNISTKVLTPSEPNRNYEELEKDPFDTSFAQDIVPSKTELKLLAKEFSCEESVENHNTYSQQPQDLLDPSDDIFQAKALTPTNSSQRTEEDIDPFDTSFAGNLNPGKTELKLLESELLN